jgi:hypothetical protein
MRRINFWGEVSLVALFGICSRGCAIKSDPAPMQPGTGGESGSGGAAGTGGAGGGTGGAAGTGGATGTGGAGGTSTTGPTTMCSEQTTAPAAPAAGMAKAPCDIYAEDGGPCVAAHSTVRSLFATYSGPLYQVKKADGTTKDIMPLVPGGFANADDQDKFCGDDACTISKLYDQSGKGNHLTKGPPGGNKPSEDKEANAKILPATFSGHKVYGLHVVPGVGYRDNTPCGTATGDDAETEYMVAAGDVYNGACCFDYGNMETSSRDDGEGTMEAVYFGNCTIWGKGAGDGPWVMGDLENGLWAGNITPYENSLPIKFKYVTAMVKGDAAGKNHWTIKSGNAQMGALITPFDGTRPSDRYKTMRKQGAVGLGTGGDNTASDTGNFFEGVMTAKYSSDKADDAVQSNIVTAYAPTP